jgi:hypothetical protein
LARQDAFEAEFPGSTRQSRIMSIASCNGPAEVVKAIAMSPGHGIPLHCVAADEIAYRHDDDAGRRKESA